MSEGCLGFSQTPNLPPVSTTSFYWDLDVDHWTSSVTGLSGGSINRRVWELKQEEEECGVGAAV